MSRMKDIEIYLIKFSVYFFWKGTVKYFEPKIFLHTNLSFIKSQKNDEDFYEWPQTITHCLNDKKV